MSGASVGIGQVGEELLEESASAADLLLLDLEGGHSPVLGDLEEEDPLAGGSDGAGGEVVGVRKSSSVIR